MVSTRDIKRRISSVVSIKQITRAMEMVATTKLRRFQARAQASRPYTEELESIVLRLAAAAPEGSLMLARARAAGADVNTAPKAAPLGVVIVTSDRGLCGAYNTNVLALAFRFLKERGIAASGGAAAVGAGKLRIYVVGKKGYVYFTKRGYEVARYFAEPPLEKVTQRSARIIAKQLADDFLQGVVSELHVFSTRFESMMSYPPKHTPWLPFELTAAPAALGAAADDPILEPNASFLLDRMIPKYLTMKLWNLLLESIAAEYASKRVSMKNATDAADEMRGALQATYNRVRQDTITRQLMEIVSGAEALR